MRHPANFSGKEFVDARAFWTLPIIFRWEAILFPDNSDYLYSAVTIGAYVLLRVGGTPTPTFSGIKDMGARGARALVSVAKLTLSYGPNRMGRLH